jgi:hypothetical protein
MLFLMGLGYSLMTKQNAVVGARAAVFYRANLEDTPPQTAMNELVRNSVSPGREQWTLNFNEENDNEPPEGGAGIISELVSGFYQGLNKEIHYDVKGTATLGFLPRIMNLRPAEASYYLPHRTWTCSQSGGSYVRVAMNGLGLPDIVKRLLDSSCCVNYESTR